jgi:hypothetical protein
MELIPQSYMEKFTFLALNVSLRIRTIMELPDYKGSTFRGGFGNAFKKSVCFIKNKDDKDCNNCILKNNCVYLEVFETPIPPQTKIMRKYEKGPHPFIIEPPLETRTTYYPGETLAFKLILIGRAIEYLPFFIRAWIELGHLGLGKGRDKGHGKFELISVIDGDHIIYRTQTKIVNSIPPSFIAGSYKNNFLKISHSNIHLDFVTPTRIQYGGHLTMDLQFPVLIRNLLSRISLLGSFHCGLDFSNIDFRGILSKAKEVRTSHSRLWWDDLDRYSNRQATRLKMGGFRGEIAYEGDITPFLTLLHAGKIFHAGKITSFGMGKYNIIG